MSKVFISYAKAKFPFFERSKLNHFEIADRIKRIKSAGWSTSEIADGLNLSISHVSNYLKISTAPDFIRELGDNEMIIGSTAIYRLIILNERHPESAHQVYKDALEGKKITGSHVSSLLKNYIKRSTNGKNNDLSEDQLIQIQSSVDTDSKLAKEFQVPRSHVYMTRQRMGIPNAEIRNKYLRSDTTLKHLSPQHKEMFTRINPLSDAAFKVACDLTSIETTLRTYERDTKMKKGAFELVSDFNQGNAWTEAQQIAYVEAVFRKTAPCLILFNCPGWMGNSSSSATGDIKANFFQCLDGLQRLTACRRFIAGEFAVFEKYKARDLKGSPFDPRGFSLQFCIYEINSRADLLDQYLRINAGGSMHTQESLDVVRALLAQVA